MDYIDSFQRIEIMQREYSGRDYTAVVKDIPVDSQYLKVAVSTWKAHDGLDAGEIEMDLIDTQEKIIRILETFGETYDITLTPRDSKATDKRSIVIPVAYTRQIQPFEPRPGIYHIHVQYVKNGEIREV